MNSSHEELKEIQEYLKRKKKKKRREHDKNPVYYVYQHMNENTEKGDLGCRHIGKGKGQRAWDMKSGRNELWKSIFSDEQPPNVEIIARDLDEETAYEIEKWMIAIARAAGVKLCNMTDGGGGTSGWSHSAETRLKQSEAAKNISKDPNVKKRRSDALKRAFSRPGVKEKKSAILKKIFGTPENRKKRSETSKILANDPIVKAKKRLKFNETNALPEVKAKRSAGAKEMWRKRREKENNN